MIDTKPLLKGFGAAADVIGQIATDKAVNSRRLRPRPGRFDITDGQLVENVTFSSGNNVTVPHSLGRKAMGVFVLWLKPGVDGNVMARELYVDSVVLVGYEGIVCNIWIV